VIKASPSSPPLSSLSFFSGLRMSGESISNGVQLLDQANEAETNPNTEQQSEYTAFYCEENVYLLLQRLATRQPVDQHYALFISNPSRTCLLLHQRASKSAPDHYVIWDYHVVAVTRATDEAYVLDADSLLGPRVPLDGESPASFCLRFSSLIAIASAYIEATFVPRLFRADQVPASLSRSRPSTARSAFC
jgi:hypothetical protein